MEKEYSVKEKQEYLKENILDKGFDANEFADFLSSKRGEESANAAAWSMEDLRQVVQEFHEKHESRKKQILEKTSSKKEDEEGENKEKEIMIVENEDNKKKEKEEVKIKENQTNGNEINEKKKEEKKDNEEIKDKTIDKEESKKDKKNYDKKESKKESKKDFKKDSVTKQETKKEEKIPPKENTFPPEIYGIIIPPSYECKVLENTPLSSVKDLTIKVSKPEKKEGGFFSKSYITYLITTNEPNLNVRRRYSDFTWLHQTLLNLYPYVVIPPIPKKNKVVMEKFYEAFIIKRIRFLEKFLNWLVVNPVIKNSKLFYDFLSLENDEEFTKAKLAYQKIDKPMNLIEFYAKNGKMKLGINKEKETYFKNISDNTNNNTILLSNLNFSLKQLKSEFDIFIQKVEDVQKNWDALYDNSTKYFEDNNITNIYEKMSKLFKDWEHCLKKQNKLFFVDVREYFKYIKNNFRDMKEYIDNVETVKNEYYRYERYLINKKEDLFKRGEVERWEIDPQEKANLRSLAEDKLSALFKMCSKDTDKCIQRKVYYGYYLNQLIEEYERIRNFNSSKYKENQINYCRTLSEIITEFNNQIKEILTGLGVQEKVIKNEIIVESKKE